MSQNIIKIGTRRSKLALLQTQELINSIKAIDSNIITEVMEINTSGDWKPEHGEKRLCEKQGGKGLFVKEIEQALLNGQIDCAVHSMKDVPSLMTRGLAINHMLKREDPRDALVAGKDIKNIKDLPLNAIIGTSSPRRQAFALDLRKDLKIIPLRGNVPTRIQKIRDSYADATFLAVAGLKRLGLSDAVSYIMEPEEMLPSAGQGAIGVQLRENERNTLLSEILDKLNCKNTLFAVTAERAALEALCGSCHTPVGSYAIYTGKKMHLRVKIVTDNKSFLCEEITEINNVKQSYEFGKKLGTLLKQKLPEHIRSELLENT